ncbi:MAG: CbtA family protein [Nocardioidaceae bacterium]
MEKKLIGAGVLAGAVAGLVAFVFARIFAEPLIQKAIDYEGARDEAQAALDKAAGLAVAAEGPDVFSRAVQANVGIGAALILFGAALGALVAVTYLICIGRTGRIRPLQLGLLVPLFGFLGLFFVPFLKYPANPPAIGHEETIATRGALYLVTVFLSCLCLFLAVYIGQKLHQRYSTWTSTLLVGAGYIVVMAIVFAILPQLGHLSANIAEYGRHATETPLQMEDPDGTIVLSGFPADVLAEFRVYSILAQIIMWGLIAMIFAPLAQRIIEQRNAPAAPEVETAAA